MEIEVRQQKVIEVVVALHIPGGSGAERKRDLALGRGIDLLAVERLQVGDGLGEARLELGDRRFVVFVARRLGTARREAPRLA